MKTRHAAIVEAFQLHVMLQDGDPMDAIASLVAGWLDKPSTAPQHPPTKERKAAEDIAVMLLERDDTGPMMKTIKAHDPEDYLDLIGHIADAIEDAFEDE
jgi:hypothetical protein